MRVKINPYQQIPHLICPATMSLLMAAAISSVGATWEVDPDSEAWKAALAEAAKIDCAKHLPPGPSQSLPPTATSYVAPPSIRNGPGDFVKIVLSHLGIEPGPNCGCEEMRRQMNQWGWFGCWWHRKEIHAWFAAKAGERGFSLTPVGLTKLFVQAARGKLKGG
jgi:hypothetical protein